jgi:hypothetical protein
VVSGYGCVFQGLKPRRFLMATYGTTEVVP